MQARANRERAAYDEGEVNETSGRWHGRFRHVFEAPNTLRFESRFVELLTSAARGRRVLELGCGDGENAQVIASPGASYVLGVDVAESFVKRAQARAIPPGGSNLMRTHFRQVIVVVRKPA